jgi:hypothetical protein
MAVLGAALAVFVPIFRAARHAALQVECSYNLKSIGLALHNYHDTFRQLPPAYHTDAKGKPTHSWRIDSSLSGKQPILPTVQLRRAMERPIQCSSSMEESEDLHLPR